MSIFQPMSAFATILVTLNYSTLNFLFNHLEISAVDISADLRASC
jgi:hypothetical protein